MNFIALKLEMKSPLHLSRGWGDLDKSEQVVHSDSLKSAIYAAGLQLFPEWKNEHAAYFDGYNISSCFPYYNSEFFLPVLNFNKDKLECVDEDENLKRKTVKKIEYISNRLYGEYLKSDIFSFRKSQLSQSGKMIFADDNEQPDMGNHPDIFEDEVQQRVQVSFNDDAKPFFADRIFFRKGAGLYFLANFKNEELKQKVFKALTLLGSLGIGTDRTVGNGFFEFDENKHVMDKFVIDVPEQTDAWACLGMYWPQKQEINKIEWNKSTWNLQLRGGYIAGSEYENFRHLFKKNVYMFSPGSIFFTNQKPEGRYDDMRPEWNDKRMHPVWRCGKPVFIPVKLT